MLREFRPVLVILGRFVGVYLLLILLYQLYLNAYGSSQLDPFSTWVARQVLVLQQWFGYASGLQEYPAHRTSVYLIHGKPVSRMVEGCNALSVMILFLAFILAFYRGKVTLLFIGLSLVFLHITNILRISLLNIVLYEMPEYGKMLHDYLFPAVIYGAVVLLWLIWMNKFALKPTR